MRILEINKFNFAKGGADRHFLDLVAGLEEAGHEVAVFSMQHPKNLPSQWEKHFLSTVGYTSEYTFRQKLKGLGRMFWSREAKQKINAILDDFMPEIVHIHNIYHQLSPCILFEIKKRGLPVIMTIHDYKLVNPNYFLYVRGKFYDRCRNGHFYQCALDRCVKNSFTQSFIAMLEMYWHTSLGTYLKNIDLYLVPSRFAAKLLTERGLDEAKTKVMPLFINTSGSDQDSSSPAERYALFAGRLSKAKNVDELIEIFLGQSDYKLYLAGAIEDDLEIPGDKRIKYLGYLNPVMLKRYIAGAELIVSGSHLPETFGLVAAEAIAQGKPFLGYATGAYPEIIENGQNGILVKDAEDFGKTLDKFANGEIKFDTSAIRAEALEHFGKEAYISRFISLAQVLRK